jgi:hypothetical protein
MNLGHLMNRPKHSRVKMVACQLRCVLSMRQTWANPWPITPMTCKAHSSRTRKPCRASAIRGGVVCVAHGGRAPQVRRKAQERLVALINPAINALSASLKSKDGKVKLAAARDVLDRNDYGPSQKLQLSGAVQVTDPGRDRLSDDELTKLLALARGAAAPGE